MIRGIDLVAAERSKQIAKGFDVFHDSDEFHQNGEMAMAAVFAITGDNKHYPQNWNKDYAEKLVCKHDLERNIISAALLIAEIDRKLTQLRHNGYTDEMIADMEGMPKIIKGMTWADPLEKEEGSAKSWLDELADIILSHYAIPEMDEKNTIYSEFLTTSEILLSLAEEHENIRHNTSTLVMISRTLKEKGFQRISLRKNGHKNPVICWAVKRIN